MTAAPNATPPVTADDVLENIKKNQLVWNYLIVALEGPPLEVVLNLTTNDPFNAWRELVNIYEPSTMEAYSQLLREMENCNMEDPMESPEVWLYKLDSINRRMGEIDASYRKLDIQMIVYITLKLPREHYQPLIMAYSLNGFAGVTLSAFQKKVIKFWQPSIKLRFTETNVTMSATQYGSMANQV